MNEIPQKSRRSNPIGLGQQIALLTLAIAPALWRDWNSLRDSIGVPLWTLATSLEIVPYLIWLLVLPIFHFGWGRSHAPTRPRPPVDGPRFVVGFLVGAGVLASFTFRFRELPPLFHDEHSYLFQAETFLSGRLCMPPPIVPSAFDQRHVLTDGAYASRYFPGTGLWLAPWVKGSLPYVSGWILAGLSTGCAARLGSRFSPATGWIALLLVATAPAALAFDSLLLSTAPTATAFLVFANCYERLWSTGRTRWAIGAGLSIGLAFLCRPLTAAGLGLPFACHALLTMSQSKEKRRGLVAMTAPFLSLAALMLPYNAAITGHPFKTPYGVYNDQRTPSHGYGFYNLARGADKRSSSRLDRDYDDWAIEQGELTPARSLRLDLERWTKLVDWTIGLSPGLGLLALAVARATWGAAIERLLVLSALSLTAAYTPYAFPGILGFSYVAEASAILALLAAIVLGDFHANAAIRGRTGVGMWWLLLALIPVSANLFINDPRLFSDGSELIYPRRESAERLRQETLLARQGPILVLVAPERSLPRHSTFVHNHPSLTGPIVRAWEQPNNQTLLDAFSDRRVYRYVPSQGEWTLLRQPRRSDSTTTGNLGAPAPR